MNLASILACHTYSRPNHLAIACQVSENFQMKWSYMLYELKILAITGDNCGSHGTTTQRDQDVIEEPLGKLTAHLWQLLKQPGNDYPGFLPDEMGWSDDTSRSLEGFVEGACLSAMSDCTGSRQQFLDDHGTGIREGNISEIARTKGVGKRCISEHRDVDACVIQYSCGHLLSHMS